MPDKKTSGSPETGGSTSWGTRMFVPNLTVVHSTVDFSLRTTVVTLLSLVY